MPKKIEADPANISMNDFEKGLIDPTLPLPPPGKQHTSQGLKPIGKVSDLND